MPFFTPELIIRKISVFWGNISKNFLFLFLFGFYSFFVFGRSIFSVLQICEWKESLLFFV